MSLRIPQLSSPLTSHLPIGDGGTHQCPSESLSSAHLSPRTFLLATAGPTSVPQNPSAQLTSHLAPSYWRRRDPPVSLRIPQHSSPLTSHLPIGDGGTHQCPSESLS